MIKSRIKKILNKFGVEIKKFEPETTYPWEADREEIELIEELMALNSKNKSKDRLTMCSIKRLWAAISATKYVIREKIDGDIIECGVWRGGCSIAMAKTIKRFNSNKKIILYDTFAGMTRPTEDDVKAKNGRNALKKFNDLNTEGYNKWCYASVEEVKASFKKYGLLDIASFRKGDISAVLKDNKDDLPTKISLLRLDTDWYESTKDEMEILYPKVSKNGILLVDDYGSWEGARKAIDEYFLNSDSPIPMQWVTDYTGRGYVKI
tara:strand:+ start:1108 stop:1899 length:792 start_codon:yes stop_codon:yes gene_type:complete